MVIYIMPLLTPITKPSTSHAVTIAMLIILIGLAPLLVYLSLDSHFDVKLTAGFTAKGISDENTFSILLGSQSVNSTDQLNHLSNYKQLNIPYNYTIGEISTDFVQPQSDKIIGFMNMNKNYTNQTLTNMQSFDY